MRRKAENPLHRSKLQIFIHLVWTTKNRESFLESPDVERAVHRCIEREAQKLGCIVLALDGVPDHVHLIVQLPATICIAELVKAVKGASSTLARQTLLPNAGFGWQDHYGAFSVSRSHVKKTVSYVCNQKRHHAEDDLWPALEEVDEGASP